MHPRPPLVFDMPALPQSWVQWWGLRRWLLTTAAAGCNLYVCLRMWVHVYMCLCLRSTNQIGPIHDEQRGGVLIHNFLNANQLVLQIPCFVRSLNKHVLPPGCIFVRLAALLCHFVTSFPSVSRKDSASATMKVRVGGCADGRDS